MAGTPVTFNIQDGFCEALVRGYRLGFLTDAEFTHLQQSETTEDIKLNLQETDYGTFLANEPTPISPSTIRLRAIDKMVAEFEYIRSQASMPLAKFLDFITYDYQIDNLMLLLKATLNNPNVSVASLIEQAHPLGQFSKSALKRICDFENSPRGYAELYQTVLIDLPVGKYMKQFLADSRNVDATGEVRGFLAEMPTTKLENHLRKYYLEDFMRFCDEEIQGETAMIMKELLKSRADAIAINITLNSFNTPLNEPNMRKDREGLFPNMGHMYPEGFAKIANCGSEDELRLAVSYRKEYKKIMETYSSGTKSIDDLFFEKEVMDCELAFEGQFNYACFYAYIRLKEAEIRNLTWISECVVQRAKTRINQHYVPIFSRSANWRCGKR